jgi:ATP-dependent Clp protease adaptor protein ClpS
MQHHPPAHITFAKPKPLWEEDTDILIEEDIGSGLEARIIVWNDDVNTFDWVIECFMDVLGHTSEQSEQLALIIHTKGKAIVKTGAVEDLRPKCDALQDRGLSAELDVQDAA